MRISPMPVNKPQRLLTRVAWVDISRFDIETFSIMKGRQMSANAARQNREDLIAYLRRHDWTKAQAKAFVSRHESLLGEATYDDWEDPSVAHIEASA
jgi:hypothetical protein